MTYANVAVTSSLDLSTFLKIYQTNGVYNNLPTQSDLWKYFMKQRVGGAEGRKLTYLLRTGYGPGAVQNLAINEGDYPAAQRSTLSEATAEYKDFGLTVSVPRSLLHRTGSDLVQYADPLTEELDAKAIVAARIMSAQTMGDGTGEIGHRHDCPVDFQRQRGQVPHWLVHGRGQAQVRQRVWYVPGNGRHLGLVLQGRDGRCRH